MRFLQAKDAYLIILLPAIYFAVFLHLDALPFRVWDEAYLAQHTYEMLHDHDYIVTHSSSKPEMSNTKPPLAIWCMVLSSKLLGFNVLSVRLPNAIAGVLVCLIMFFFMSGFLGSSLTAFLSVLILLSTSGFVKYHVIRTGEYDALLTMFTFIFCICFFMILEAPDHAGRWMLWTIFTLALAGAILTKGIAGVLTLPGLFIYALLRKKVLPLMRSRESYISIFVVLFLGLGYYFLREHFNPGYLDSVNKNELNGRYVEVNEGHVGPFSYYWVIIRDQLIFVFPFIVIGIAKAIIEGFQNRISRMVLFLCITSFLFLLVLSLGATKIHWYDAPAVPMLVMIAGCGLTSTLNFLYKLKPEMGRASRIIATSLIILLIIGPAYSDTIASDLSMQEEIWYGSSFTIPHFIKQKESEGANFDGYKVLYDAYMFHAEWCQVKELEDKGQKLSIVKPDSLKTGDRIFTRSGTRAEIDGLFYHQTIDASDDIEVWLLTAPRLREAK